MGIFLKRSLLTGAIFLASLGLQCREAIAITAPLSEQVKPAQQWMKVPAWLVGSWQTNSQVILYSRNWRTNRVAISEPIVIRVARSNTIGSDRDATGQYWHNIGVPYMRRVETDAYHEIHEMNRIEIVEERTDALVVSSDAIVTRIDRENNSLLDKFCEKTITTYSPIEDGVIQVNYCITDFDSKGQLLQATRSTSIEKKTSLH